MVEDFDFKRSDFFSLWWGVLTLRISTFFFVLRNFDSENFDVFPVLANFDFEKFDISPVLGEF